MARHTEPDVLFSRPLIAGVSDMLKEWRKFNAGKADVIIEHDALDTSGRMPKYHTSPDTDRKGAEKKSM